MTIFLFILLIYECHSHALSSTAIVYGRDGSIVKGAKTLRNASQVKRLFPKYIDCNTDAIEITIR